MVAPLGAVASPKLVGRQQRPPVGSKNAVVAGFELSRADVWLASVLTARAEILTIIPTIEAFTAARDLPDATLVADAGMVSR